jgi:L-amino acid N-acyltransferase YncA
VARPLALRLATPADAAGCARIYAPHVTEGYASFEAAPPSGEEVAERIVRVLEQLPWLVGTDEAGVLGYAYATPHRARGGYRWCVECSVYVHPDAQRRGIGRALYAALHALLVGQGLVNAYAGIALPNPASVALHEAAGYRPVAVYPGIGYKAGAWRDVGWWHRPLAPPAARPALPRPLPALSEAEVEAALDAGRALLR